MNDPFVERIEKTRNKKGKKVSGRMVVEKRSKKASEAKKAMLNLAIHLNPAQDENRAGRGAEENENRRLTSDSTPTQ